MTEPQVRILAIAPEGDLRSLVTGTLGAPDYDLVVVPDGADAFALYDTHGPFDLYVVDLVNPARRGDDFVRHLRAIHPDVRVLLFTGFSFTGYRGLLADAPPVLRESDAFVEQPATAHGLRAAVSFMLGGPTPGAAPRVTRVLIIDDDVTTADHFARLLRYEGYEVATAPDGEAGLRAVVSGGFDAVLVDLRMPRVTGLEWLRVLRQIPSGRETPVALVTGDYMMDEATQTELAQLGAVVRFKPLWPDDLTTLTKTLLERRPNPD
jgi:CheY-like chemotaxis protein